MPTTDRRHSIRTKPDQLAYLKIEPDNGGIILNVSEEGLCFHAMAPIQTDGTLRLSLQELNRKIDLCGELVWTDDAKKSGGVRFDNLSPEARDRISDWTRVGGPAAETRSTLGAALLKILPAPESRRIAHSLEPAAAGWKSGIRVRVSGFTRGLAAGFLLSLAAFSVLLYSYVHRAGLGESLIRMGQRLTGTQVSHIASQSPPQQVVAATATPSAAVVVPVEKKISAKLPGHVAPAQVEDEPDDVTIRLLTPPHTAPSSSAAPAQNVAQQFGSTAAKDVASQPNAPNLPAAGSANNSVPAPPAVVAALPSTPEPGLVSTSLRSEVAPPPTPSLDSSKLEMFFDLGRFKTEPMARDLHTRLAQLGIESSVVAKRRLWGSFYQVLAGPYDDYQTEKRIHDSLLSHGYKPRPFERGTRDFAFHSKLTIDGSPLPTGNFTIAWESFISDAKVRFTQSNGLLAAVDGRWVKHSSKFVQNEYVYQVQPDGSKPLLELHFGGMDRALVFRGGKP